MIRTADVFEGLEITLPELGPCVVVKTFPSGAAIVRDYDDRRWLLQRDYFRQAEVSLFNYQ